MCALYKGERLIAGVATPVDGARSIGQIVQSTIPLVDAGLHLLDGSIIEGNGIYSAFVGYISNIDPSFLCTEAEWQQAVTNYGVCGKFVYNSALNTVRLPLYSNNIYTTSISSTSPVSGNGKTLGISDGTDLYGMDGVVTSYGLRAVKESADKDIGTTGAAAGGTVPPQYSILGVTTDGTKSGLITDLTDITSPLTGFYYIVIATNTKTDIEVDIDEVATDLNGKVDKSSLVEAKIVIESYSSGSSWYRIYSDGWCEQGATIPAGTSTVTFAIPFTTAPLVFNYSAVPYSGGYLYEEYTAYPTSTGYTRYYPNMITTYEAKGYVYL